LGPLAQSQHPGRGRPSRNRQRSGRVVLCTGTVYCNGGRGRSLFWRRNRSNYRRIGTLRVDEARFLLHCFVNLSSAVERFILRILMLCLPLHFYEIMQPYLYLTYALMYEQFSVQILVVCCTLRVYPDGPVLVHLHQSLQQ